MRELGPAGGVDAKRGGARGGTDSGGGGAGAGRDQVGASWEGASHSNSLSPVHEVVVHELEDLVLDCELSWHRISAGLNNYTFYRVGPTNSCNP